MSIKLVFKILSLFILTVGQVEIDTQDFNHGLSRSGTDKNGPRQGKSSQLYIESKTEIEEHDKKRRWQSHDLFFRPQPHLELISFDILPEELPNYFIWFEPTSTNQPRSPPRLA